MSSANPFSPKDDIITANVTVIKTQTKISVKRPRLHDINLRNFADSNGVVETGDLSYIR